MTISCIGLLSGNHSIALRPETGDRKNLVAYVHTGTHNWLDFSLNPEAQLDLFHSGVNSAAAFLRSFRWSEYKHLRETLAEANTRSNALG